MRDPLGLVVDPVRFGTLTRTMEVYDTSKPKLEITMRQILLTYGAVHSLGGAHVMGLLDASLRAKEMFIEAGWFSEDPDAGETHLAVRIGGGGTRFRVCGLTLFVLGDLAPIILRKVNAEQWRQLLALSSPSDILLAASPVFTDIAGAMVGSRAPAGSSARGVAAEAAELILAGEAPDVVRAKLGSMGAVNKAITEAQRILSYRKSVDFLRGRKSPWQTFEETLTHMQDDGSLCWIGDTVFPEEGTELARNLHDSGRALVLRDWSVPHIKTQIRAWEAEFGQVQIVIFDVPVNGGAIPSKAQIGQFCTVAQELRDWKIPGLGGLRRSGPMVMVFANFCPNLGICEGMDVDRWLLCIPHAGREPGHLICGSRAQGQIGEQASLVHGVQLLDYKSLISALSSYEPGPDEMWADGDTHINVGLRRLWDAFGMEALEKCWRGGLDPVIRFHSSRELALSLSGSFTFVKSLAGVALTFVRMPEERRLYCLGLLAERKRRLGLEGNLAHANAIRQDMGRPPLEPRRRQIPICYEAPSEERPHEMIFTVDDFDVDPLDPLDESDGAYGDSGTHQIEGAYGGRP
jgi:hypothetical protein